MSSILPYYNNTIFNDSVNNLDQLSAEYARIGYNNQRRNNPDDFVDNNKVAGSALSGLSTGASIGGSAGQFIGMLAGNPLLGGIIGTAVGGVAGAGIGYAGSKMDENNRVRTADAMNALNQINNDENILRAGYSADILQDRLYRQSEAHAVAEGGQIERKQMSLKDFSDYVLKKKPVNAYAENSRVVRTYCKGGVKISFK